MLILEVLKIPYESFTRQWRRKQIQSEGALAPTPPSPFRFRRLC